MRELYETAYPDKPAVLVCLLYVGTYLFVGAPKVGNSFLMAQFAYQVSTGSPCGATLFAKALFSILLWRTTTATYKVDSIGCLGQTVPRVCLRRRRQAPGRGLTEQLEKFLREHLDIELIVIDIFQKIQEAEGAQYSYFGNYEVMAQLEAFADCHSVCLLLIHHTRKQQKISSI